MHICILTLMWCVRAHVCIYFLIQPVTFPSAYQFNTKISSRTLDFVTNTDHKTLVESITDWSCPTASVVLSTHSIDIQKWPLLFNSLKTIRNYCFLLTTAAFLRQGPVSVSSMALNTCTLTCESIVCFTFLRVSIAYNIPVICQRELICIIIWVRISLSLCAVPVSTALYSCSWNALSCLQYHWCVC